MTLNMTFCEIITFKNKNLYRAYPTEDNYQKEILSEIQRYDILVDKVKELISSYDANRITQNIEIALRSNAEKS